MINIKLTHPNAKVPEYQTSGSAGFDIATVEDVRFNHFQDEALVRTGLVVETPRDHVLLTFPRSSTYKKWGIKLSNSIGVIDSDYAGNEDEIKLQLLYEGEIFAENDPYIIPAGTRLAQGLFIPVKQTVFQVVEDMTQQSRGGFGSTGSGVTIF